MAALPIDPLAAAFPEAGAYGRLLGRPLAFRESPAAYAAAFHWSERHLQCLWADSRLRPAELPLEGGGAVRILDPGEWNLEAGPDFRHAALRVEPEGREVTGDVEIHIRPSDWDSHGHARDPAYAGVVAHVTWEPGPRPRTLPAGVLRLSLAGAMKARPEISLDDLDLKAYPHAVLPATPRPCQTVLAADPATAAALLTAAGQYRLREKACRLAARLAETGDADQVLYEEVMAALGYKHNQAPFRLLSRLLPVGALTALDRVAALAAFLGYGRLLPDPSAASDAAGARLLRSLWDSWWRLGGLPPEAPAVGWTLSGIRPQNAPVRRLAAAAALFAGIGNFVQDFRQLAGSDAAWFAHLAAALRTRTDWPYWKTHLGFASRSDPSHPAELLGDSRIAAVIINVLLPLALDEALLRLSSVRSLPPEDLSAPMRETAHLLFGRDHNPALYAGNGLYQQGLLQIHQDFCLTTRSDCARCALAAALRATKS